MGMEKQDVIDELMSNIDEVGQVLKDWDKVREMVGVGDHNGADPDSAQSKLTELLLVVAGHQNAWGHEQIKEAAKQWLEKNVSGLGDFYSDDDEVLDDSVSVAKYEREVLGTKSCNCVGFCSCDGE
jgi:hypothetical protein